ncbi:MAG: nicotinate phosphoribosyltransferase [Erysipelotrichales bacterium]
MKTLSLHTDLYQINMAYAFFNDNVHERKATFELYFRKNPFGNGYAVYAGLERIVEYLSMFKFNQEDIDYLRHLDYSEEFLEYLSNISFTGKIRSVLEGEIVFAKEPLVIVEANLIEAQLIETALLNIVNFQTLIATKASRIKNIAATQLCMEFGSRRAHEMDAALWGTRAAYICGFDGTSLVEAGRRFGIPIMGTHSHSFVQVYQDEYIAFKKYAQSHKECTFLVDTYDTLKSGIPNAIKVANEFDSSKNTFNAIRIDSGDLAYQSKEARRLLGEAGYHDTKITVSNDLDEETIASLLLEGARIDSFGIGTKLITAYDQPALGAVYKLVAIENEEGSIVDVIKTSDNTEKVTTPGSKVVYRIVNKDTNKSAGDYIALKDEYIDESLPLKMFDELSPLNHKMIKNFKAIDIHKDIYIDGKLVYDLPTIEQIRAFHQSSLTYLWDENRRYKNPAKYFVDLSQACWDNKRRLIEKYKKSL